MKKDKEHRVIKDIYFPTPLDNYFIGGEKVKSLKGAQSLNLITGANNSGKSRFIRELLKLDFEVLVNESLDDYLKLFDELISLNPTNVDKEDLTGIKDCIEKKEIHNYCNYRLNFSNLTFENNNERGRELSNRLGRFDKIILRKAIYIPALRSAHTLYDDSDPVEPIKYDIYEKTISNNYFFGNDNEDRLDFLNGREKIIFTGLNLFEEIEKTQGADRDIRVKFAKFESFLSDNFFDGGSVELTASRGSRNVLVSIEGSEERPLYGLGDGIQAIIVLLYSVFMAEKDTLIVIDEPELHLHPGFQRIFMQTITKLLKERNDNTIVFIVTHSNHLMDLTLTQESVSIYSFSENKEKSGFSIRACKAGDYSLLSDLGVNSSSAFIANSSIWVEGPTDRKYLKFFLNKYVEKIEKHLKEDIDYAFYEYGGSLIAHYDFNEQDEAEALESGIKAFALANRIFLLADRDSTEVGGSDKKSERLDRFEKIAEGVENFHFEKTKGIEIENMLPASVYKEFIHELYNGGKSSVVEAKIGSLVTTDYEDEKIGGFLFSILKKSKMNEDKIKSIETSSGTLQTSLKTKLCNFVCDSYSEIPYDELVDSGSGLDQLIKTLYDFVVNE